MTDYTWITAPPIRKLDPTQTTAAIEQMKLNMADWGTVTVPSDPARVYAPRAPNQSQEDYRAAQLTRRPPDVDANDWQSPRRTVQERWNDRIGSTNLMLKMKFTGHVVGYFVDNVAVALMALIEGEPIYIADLVCHPGSENGGGIMIEYAVNLAAKTNSSPKVELYALDDEAGRAYQQIGFAYDSGNSGTMTLDPQTSTKWASSGERWHLAKFATMQTYLS